MSSIVYILNGPNLNRLGSREPQLYGSETLETLRRRCLQRADGLGVAIDFRQTNSESTLIDHVHDAIDHADAIVINPAGLSFTSMPLLDALKMFDQPKVEVHITNIHRREAIYHRSLVSTTATAVMAGFGTDGYLLALDWVAGRLNV